MLLVQAIEVVTAIDDRETALEMARKAVEQRLAACAQVTGPACSTYRWKGALEHAEEWLVIFKAPQPLRERLATFISQEHPYELPEILCREVLVSQAYHGWMEQVTGEGRVQG